MTPPLLDRVQEYFKREIKEKIINNNILISAHGNSIRALCKHLLKLDNNQIAYLEIPTGNPLILELNDKFDVEIICLDEFYDMI